MGYQDKDDLEGGAVPPVTERGPWVATTTGRMWSLFDPRPSDVHLTDIAYGLSRICRYGGQIRVDREFYSVAEHSSLMTVWMIGKGIIQTREDALKCHLHDAPEAFLGDMKTPLKALMPEYKVIETGTDAVISEAFGLDRATLSHAAIKEVDIRIRMDEREALIAEPALGNQKRVVWEKTPGLTGIDVEIRGLLPFEACRNFLETFLICCDLPSSDPDLDDRLFRFQEEARSALRDLSGPGAPAPS